MKRNANSASRPEIIRPVRDSKGTVDIVDKTRTATKAVFSER
jgi:hypothetical protein